MVDLKRCCGNDAAEVVGKRGDLWKHVRKRNKKMTGSLMIGFLRNALLVCILSLVGSFAAGTTPSAAADYPNRPVKWLIGFAAGGPVDIVARIMRQWLSDRRPAIRGREPRRLRRQYRGG